MKPTDDDFEPLNLLKEDVDDEAPEDEIPEDAPDLTFEDITAADDLAEERLYIKAWGGFVTIRGLTKREFDQMRTQARMKQARNKRSEVMEQEIVIAGMVRPQLTASKYQVILEKNAGAIADVLVAIMKKSGLTEETAARNEQRFPGQ